MAVVHFDASINRADAHGAALQAAHHEDRVLQLRKRRGGLAWLEQVIIADHGALQRSEQSDMGLRLAAPAREQRIADLVILVAPLRREGLEPARIDGLEPVFLARVDDIQVHIDQCAEQLDESHMLRWHRRQGKHMDARRQSSLDGNRHALAPDLLDEGQSRMPCIDF